MEDISTAKKITVGYIISLNYNIHDILGPWRMSFMFSVVYGEKKYQADIWVKAGKVVISLKLLMATMNHQVRMPTPSAPWI